MARTTLDLDPAVLRELRRRGIGTVKTRTRLALRRLRERLEPAMAAEKRAAAPCSERGEPSLCHTAT